MCCDNGRPNGAIEVDSREDYLPLITDVRMIMYLVCLVVFHSVG
jgi:hypothetical protein